MIERQEISELARELSLDLHVVEKDYVLGWLLAGIAANPQLSENWVFKGGTCLKKCYFETYRFSEDLDFMVTEEAQLDEDYLLQAFLDILPGLKTGDSYSAHWRHRAAPEPLRRVPGPSA
ncbi:nucleotidyl transferase AbiEii/AbiGii toxin family protein [Methylococcus capsulatus]|uniref:nucleotidyl transferase AbiEii/AbiGii toxin family protein n=1 Tax=Methylococcus capsulatus TaxID=414 RepID=UPI001C532B5B|nr:nucleotidyl transferase AbiEii/AbiGii toxin family protein [Methylococcus capsulatus]QXP89621.1 nucleotidyl transferase AbiEii/AbiGii toxin family protein [Methylococcus capsulatus]